MSRGADNSIMLPQMQWRDQETFEKVFSESGR